MASGRAAEQIDRARNLTPEHQSTIRSLAETRSRRELAADYSVSHETIRLALQNQQRKHGIEAT